MGELLYRDHATTNDPHSVTVDTLIGSDLWRGVDIAALAFRAASAVIEHLRLGAGWEVAVLACDDARIAELNGAFRGVAKSTNVLSWPSADRGSAVEGGEPAHPEMDDPELGDIAIAYETCATEAEATGVALEDHVQHLLVHGVMHLLGYDHETEADAILMEGLEVEILATLGLPDPYVTRGPA